MDVRQIEADIEKLCSNINADEFIYNLLLIYGIPKATVTLLKKGKHDLSKKENRVILKRKIFFEEVKHGDLHATIDSLQKDETTMRHNPRFIIVTDYKTLLSVDTKTAEQLDIQIHNLAKHFDFFLPWAGIEKHKHTSENPADRKAAEKMAKLYDGILGENKITDEGRTHDLNIFLSRLLFCFFSEDTNIFDNKYFTYCLGSHTKEDGSDMHIYLERFFEVLNAKDTSEYPEYLRKFPYVNGGLFAKKHWIPTFNAKSRKTILECGELNWAQINPDIFGSMIQAVVHPGQRESLGMHYTSVPNIMKVIEPLFLNELKEELENSKGNKIRLLKLLDRIRKIKFFDPACGSGNFLIITYKEIRRLEMQILNELHSSAYFRSSLTNYYGIEIDDFAHSVAKLSLYLAEHQMNLEFKEQFEKINPTLPLGESGNIVCANATRIDWDNVCPKNEMDEIYVFGNPPYLGSSLQSKAQKEDLESVCKKFKNYKNLDYIACWFIKGVEYIKGNNIKMAFVSTNSICQGEQVTLLWPFIFKNEIEISYAYTSFKWSNNAKYNAVVAVVIIGLRNKSEGEKYLFGDNTKKSVSNINNYLISYKEIFVYKRTKPFSNLPLMSSGNKPADGGHLILNEEEKNTFLSKNPEGSKYIKKLLGAMEFINNINRYCLWIETKDLEDAMHYDFIRNRIELTKKFRLECKDEGARKLALKPHQFRDFFTTKNLSIIIPQTGSERREYIPIGFVDSKVIISNAARVIYDTEPWVFGIISSKMHMVWVRTVAGRLKTDMQYSNTLCYNTFPIQPLTSQQKQEIQRHVFSILEARESHSEKNMSELYDPDKMPANLKEAHNALDLTIERIYRSKPFENDEQRLEYLFKLYEQMIVNEKK